MVNPSAGNVIIRNVGLIDTAITGHFDVGGLIGNVAYGTCTNGAGLTVGNSYVDGTVTGASTVGGLIGFLNISSLGSATIANSHSDAAVMMTAVGNSGNGGGLIGQANFATLMMSLPRARSLRRLARRGSAG